MLGDDFVMMYFVFEPRCTMNDVYEVMILLLFPIICICCMFILCMHGYSRLSYMQLLHGRIVPSIVGIIIACQCAHG